MPLQIAPVLPHPGGEGIFPAEPAVPLIFDTEGRRFHVEWDPEAAVTPLGQLVFFSQFLATSGLFRDWVKDCPLSYSSPNAPKITDLLGTITLAILSGQWRYSHLSALRADKVNPAGLGMEKVCSEDSVRRAFQDEVPEPLAQWQLQHLLRSVEPALQHPWILDLDVSVKPIYGHQEGAEAGYNPRHPGRPCHAYHTCFVANLRLVLDVEVHPGKQHAPKHGFEGLWRLVDGLAAHLRPYLIRGDCAYGQEQLLMECERRLRAYLFRLRQTPRVKELIRWLERQGSWQPVGKEEWAKEGRLRLSGWTQERRVVVIRRQRRSTAAQPTDPLLDWPDLAQVPEANYEYIVLVTNLDWELLALIDGYRQRADAENVYDELKNQWGWGGFTTRDLLRCQVAARNVALIYNWWNLFVRLAEPERPREAITSRPLLLCAVGQLKTHAGQTVLRLTSSHAEASRVQGLLTRLSLFLSGLRNTAEQLSPAQCWQRIYDRILAPLLAPTAALPAPSG